MPHVEHLLAETRIEYDNIRLEHQVLEQAEGPLVFSSTRVWLSTSPV